MPDNPPGFTAHPPMTSPTIPALEFDDLTVAYMRGRQALEAVRSISLRIAPGQAYGLVGESGSGKTTLALAAMHYLPANGRISGGAVRVAGRDLAALSPAELQALRRQQVRLVPQDPLSSLNPSLRIGPQLDQALVGGQQRRSQAGARVADLLSRVRIADPQRVAASYPHQLSGGMLQRVLIAMALAGQPAVLVLDEPTTNLDVTTEAAILDLIRDLVRAQGAAILHVSHNLAVVASLCDRVAVLYAGELVEDLTPAALRGRPLHPYTRGLLDCIPRAGQRATDRPVRPIAGAMPRLDALPVGCVFAPRCPLALARCHETRPELEATPDGLVRCHRWREIQDGAASAQQPPEVTLSSAGGSPDGPAALRTTGLTKLFPLRRAVRQALRGAPARAVHALDGVDLHVDQGRTLGLVGESGSGKTTAARCIVGLVERSGGEVRLFDLPLAPGLAQRDQTTLRQLQMVFQNPEEALNPSRTVGDVLRRPLERLTGLSPADAGREAARLLEAVRLDPSYLERTPGQLSGGEKQRVAIARALATRPGVVIFDEAVSSLDVSVQAALLNLMAGLQDASDAAWLFISHDLAVVSYLADDIAVMVLGQVVEAGPAHQVLTPPWHPYTEALLAAAPRLESAAAGRVRLEGDLPSIIDLPDGCRFHTRCPRSLGDLCRTQAPPWRVTVAGHGYRCHIAPDDLTPAQTELAGALDEQIAGFMREMGDGVHAEMQR